MTGTAPEPLLSARGIGTGYGAVQVLRDIELAVGRGEIVGLLGGNGMGKTTLLRTLSGIQETWSGSVSLGDRDVTAWPAQRRARAGLCQVTSGNAVFGSLTVAENLRMYAYRVPGGRTRVRRAVAEVFDRVPRLAERRGHAAATLSGGERQMLALSQAFVVRPEVLLVDEFSLGLAPVAVDALAAMVRELAAEGTGVLLVEQSVHTALRLVSRAAVMVGGRLVHAATADELRATPDLIADLVLGRSPEPAAGGPRAEASGAATGAAGGTGAGSGDRGRP